MKKIIIVIFLLCANMHLLTAQALYNNGATLYVNAPAATTATVKINGAIENNGTIINAGRIDYTTTFANNGTLTGAGTLGVGTGWTNSATAAVAPGTSGVGAMIILGRYTSGSSALTLELGGTTAGSLHDYLSVSGAADVTNGVLNVSFTSGYTPVGGESFVVLDAASLSGTFATLNLPTLTGALT